MARPLLPLALLALSACGDKDGGSTATGEGSTTTDADADGYSLADGDCDDAEAAVHPGADEVCDGLDNDCDGATDDEDDDLDLATATTWYTDADGDGFGADEAPVTACAQPEDAAADAGDCDDGDPAVNPGAAEVCDDADTDEDCSGAADDADPGVDPTTQQLVYDDADGDGFGDDATARATCEPPSGAVDQGGDCDDADAAIHPDAAEVCDADDTDEDCDGLADDDDDDVDPTTQTRTWPDADGDGYGDATGAGALACDPPAADALEGTDCDDADPAVNPGATEVCDEADTDEDCSGAADDADAGVDRTTRTTWYADDDGDGYGDQDDLGQPWCDAPAGRVDDRSDCDDGDAAVNPGATEICDAVDNDCDASTSQWGMVSFIDAAGATTDVTTTWSGGTSGSPNTLSATTAGTYAFCDGTWYANLTISADVDLTVVEGAPVIDGGDTDHVLAIQTDGVSVSVGDVTLQGGVADSVTALGYTAGGALVCDATATVSFDGTGMSGNSADVGGAIATTDCTITLEDVTLSSNEANEAGGGVFVYGSGSVTFTDSAVIQNAAPYGGGLYLYDAGEVTLLDTVVANNEAEYGGGAYVVGGTSSPALTCEGASTNSAGFTDNTSTSLDGAVALSPGSGDLTFDAADCDLGRIPTGTDNDRVGLVHTGADWIFGVGDDATFSCDADGCGDTTELDVGGDDYSFSGDNRARGNIFLATDPGTIDTFGLVLDPDSTCTLDHYVLSNTALSSSGWTVEWSDTGNSVGSGGEALYESAAAGVGVEAGTYYALITGWQCTSSSHTVGYTVQPDSSTPVDLDVATHEGNVQTSYSGTLSGTGNSLTLYNTDGQYEGAVTSTAF